MNFVNFSNLYNYFCYIYDCKIVQICIKSLKNKFTYDHFSYGEHSATITCGYEMIHTKTQQQSSRVLILKRHSNGVFTRDMQILKSYNSKSEIENLSLLNVS